MDVGPKWIPDHVLQLLADLVDPDDCWFDHNGDCQAHGYGIEPGDICPHEAAKQLLGSKGIAF